MLEAHDSGTDVLRLVERRIGIAKLREDLDRARGVARPQDTGHLDLLITESGTGGRELLASVIARLDFRASGVDEDELLAGLRLIGQLVGDQRRWLPGFSPSGFIDKAWRPHVVDTSRGRLDRRAYELCAAYELRSALRAGRAWVPGSRRHADPSSLLLPDEQWQPARASFAATVERSLDGNQRLQSLASEQAVLLKRLADERDATSEASLAEEGLVLDDLSTADQTDGRLRKLIEPRLPELDLPELLIEVDGWTGFTDHLTPLSGNRRRSADMPGLLYAVDPGASDEPRPHRDGPRERVQLPAARMDLEQLCREDTLTAASARLVDYHHGLPLAQEWAPAGCHPPTGSGSPLAAAGPGPQRCRATSGTAVAACRSTHGRLTSTASTRAT